MSGVALRDVEDVLAECTGLSRRVLEYGQRMKALVDEAKEPGFAKERWGSLADLVAIADFERVGNFKEVMDWQEYVDFLDGWARASEWECSFKRVTESGRLVFLELEERSRIGDFRSVVNSVSVYEFDEEDRIRHLDIYLQMALPGSELPAAYDDVRLTQ